MAIKIGCDPEVFLVNTKSGKVVPATGLFPGTKSKPHRVEKGAVQVDGTALEFNIDPVESEDEFVDNINHVMKQMHEMVKKVDPDLEILLAPVVQFDSDTWSNIPFYGKELGCDPDFDITGNENTIDESLMNTPIRTGSGHIHIGFDNPDDVDRLYVVQAVEQALEDVKDSWETSSSEIRRKYYGKMGAHRPKEYGVEMRSLDNTWLKSEEHMRTVFRTIHGRVSAMPF